MAVAFLSLAVAGLALVAGPAPAPGQGPSTGQEDLPGRVGRVADVAGELFIAPQDRPEAWQPAGINYPVASGDNLWLGTDGRAEVDYGGGQFRFAGDTNLHVSQLDDRHFSLFVAQGRVSLRVRALEPGDIATIDTPNAQVVVTRPGLYRLDVTEDRQRTVVVVREGEVNVLTPAAAQQVLPGQVAYVDGADPQYASVSNGVALDGFDTWVASRDRIYRVRGNNYVSPQMVGAADLDQYGTWSQMPEYGAVWYPNNVPVDWAPYRNGYWVDVGVWGPTWVDAAPWGYAPFHYGRWAFIGGRWGWFPGAYVARPLWAPALVAWTGGPGWSMSVTALGPVYGWVPLSWGEPFRPWWGRCSTGCWDRFNRPFNVNVAVVKPWSPPPQHWRNASAPGGITAVPFQAFQSRQPVAQNIVRVPRDAVSTPVLATPPVMRNDPNRGPVQRPGAAPPPASSFQTAIVRPGAPVQSRTAPAGSDGTVRMRPGQAGAPAGGTPVPAGQARQATSNGFAPAPTGPTPNQAPGRSGTAGSATQGTPSPMGREARPGMGSPSTPSGMAQPSVQSVPVPGTGRDARPGMGTQGQGGGGTPTPGSSQAPARTQQAVTPAQAAPRAQPQPSMPAQPTMRAQPQPSMPAQPTMRAQPQPMQPSTPAVQPMPRPQPQMSAPAPQPSPQQMQQQPTRTAPQPAATPQPAARGAPQAPAQAGEGQGGSNQRQGGDGGNITRGERGR